MSHSPDEPDAAADEYSAGWKAINKLLRRGRSWSGHERNVALLNCGDGPFADVSAVAGIDFPDDARGTALVDWDRDGDLDLWSTSRTSPRLRYLRNDGGRPTLGLRLEGRSGSRDAVGARVEVEHRSGRMQLATVRAAEGYLAQSSRRVVLAAPLEDPVARVRVRWPLGTTQTYEDLESGGRYHLVEGEAARREEVGPATELLRPGRLEPPAPSARARLVMPTPVPLPSLTAVAADRLGTLGFDGGPALVQLWASWCAPCLGELKTWAAEAPSVAAEGLRVLALSADEPADRKAADLFLDRVRWPFGRGFATLETLDRLDVLHDIVLENEERLALPSSFLVDGEGRLAAIYLGPVAPETVLADLRLLDAEPTERRDAAVPFPGRWLSPVPELSAARLEGDFEARGFDDVAREYQLAQIEQRVSPEAELQVEFGLARARAGELEEALQFFLRAIEVDPYHAPAHAARATALSGLGRFDAAAAAYREALRLDEFDAESWYNLGLCQLQLANRDGALEAAERLAELGDARADALRGYADRLR